MSSRTVQIPFEVENFFRDIARKSNRYGAGRSRILAFTYEFDPNSFERCFARVLKMPIHIDIVASHKSTRSTYRYNLWHANWKGTFHPKLICLMSAGEVIAGLGSSNLTSGGLQENLEAWSFSRDSGFLSGVRDFLKALAKKNIVSPRVCIDEFLALLPQRSPKAVFSTLDGDLMGQVISRLSGPVKRLDIISPIYGDPASVIEKLRSKIKGAKVCLHTDDAAIPEIKGTTEYKRLKRPEVWDEERRSIGRVHAKLYAFHSGRRVDLFWGSANLSRSAWLRSDATANIELLAHSSVGKEEWIRFIKSPLPGHKWVEMKPSGGNFIKDDRTILGWRLLNAVRENRKLYLIASGDKALNLQIRIPGTKTFTKCHLRFKNQEAGLPYKASEVLGFTASDCPNSLEWRREGNKEWRTIPVNNLDIAPDGTVFETLTDQLYWEFACKPLPWRAGPPKGGYDHGTDEILLPEEEELAISDHQGAFDRFVLEWHAVVKRMCRAAHDNKELLNQYTRRIKKEVEKAATAEPGTWPKYKIKFINELLKERLKEKWESQKK